MSYKGIIITENKDIGVFLDWCGDFNKVSGFLAYCKAKGYPSPDKNHYGWVRFCQVLGNYFYGNVFVGINRYEDLNICNLDASIYIIKKWKIIGGKFTKNDNQNSFDILDFLMDINRRMPKQEQLSISELLCGVEDWNKILFINGNSNEGRDNNVR